MKLDFAGFMQVRLATNPDPTDDPRGVSGYTFALPGEPDFDRIVRSRDAVAPRSYMPAIGVTVRTVDGDTKHPLVGATFDLVGPAKFESVNEVVMAQGTEILEPFEVAICKDRFALQRRSYIDPAQPELTVYTAPRPAILARAATYEIGKTHFLEEARGTTDPVAFRAARLAALQADLAKTTDPTERAALGRRITELQYKDPQDRRFYSMTFVERRHFALNGPTRLVDPERWLAGLDPGAPFACEIAMGAWDVDTLSFFAKGSLELPTA